MRSFRTLDDLLGALLKGLGKLPVHACLLQPPDDMPDAAPEAQRTNCAAALTTLAELPDGGVLLIGVRPDGRVVGVADAPTSEDALKSVALGCGVCSMDMGWAWVAEELVLTVHVSPQRRVSPRPPPSRTIEPARGPARPDPGLAVTCPPDRDLLPAWTLYEPDPLVRARLLAAATPPPPPRHADTDEWALLHLGAYGMSGRMVAPTIAGGLVLGGDPTEELPGAVVIVESEAGVETRVRGPMLQTIRRVAGQHGSGSFAAGVHELLLNAVLHRDWSARSRHVPIRVELTSEGVEVISPGELGAAQNATLTDLARRARWSTCEGRGLLRLRAGGASGLDVRSVGGLTRAAWARPGARPAAPMPPSAVFRPAHAPPVESRGSDSPKASALLVRPEQATGRAPAPAPAPPADAHRLDAKEAAALGLIRGGSATRQAVEQALGCSRSTARNVIEALVARGLVVRSTESARSPFQTYSLAV